MKIKKILTIFLASLISLTALFGVVGCNKETDDPTVKTVSGGKIKGYEAETEDVVVYKGIPYAAAPVGELRWKAPQDVVAWDGVKDCTKWGASAMQAKQKADATFTEEFIIEDTETYSEDCLTLNLWTKNDETENKPVVVYIHGGAFVAGGSSCEVYNGEYLASQDVVFVSVNYRLGIFGWFASSALAAEDPEGSTGNYALMDLIKALDWVQDNIAQFGGDKNNVTIMGQSAGGSLVDALLVSPKAEGLFHRAVNMSYKDMAVQYGRGIARQSAGNQLGTLEELRSKSAEELMALSWSNVGVCNDGVYITQDFQQGLQNGASKDVDIMTGMVADGDIIYLGFALMLGVPEGTTVGECLMGIQNTVVKARQMGVEEGETLGNTFVYLFNHVMPGKRNNGVFHSSDVPYFLNYFSDKRAEYWTDTDKAVGLTAAAYLINFCKTGAPNGENLPMWNASTGNYTYMEISGSSAEKQLSESCIGIIKTTFTKPLYGGFDANLF